MLHYTLNTGHTRFSPREEVGEGIFEVVRPLLKPGEHVIPGVEGFTLRVPILPKGYFATVYEGETPVCSIAVAKDDEEADDLWPNVERHYHSITDLPGIRAADFSLAKRPESTPWVAAITILPSFGLYWIADMERCLAWAWVESNQ